MSFSFTVVTTPADRVAAELLAVPISKEGAFGPGADVVDAALGGGLAAFLAETGFEGKLGETLAVPTAGKLRAKAAILVGLGDPSELTLDALRRAAAAVARRSSKAASVATTLASAGDGLAAGDAAQAVAEGFVLGAYQYLDYKRDATGTKLRKVTLLSEAGAEVRSGVTRGAAIGEAVTWARDMVNTPSKEKSPADMAAAARRLMRGTGVSVQVLDVAQIRAQRLGGVLGVGQGSHQTPRFLKLTYSPAGARGKALAFVGKGVVFDSGGSLKTASGMETMKTDMSGGAAVIAAMSTLQTLGVKTRITGYVPLVENMPSGTAIRPGDVLRIRNGKTVEVLNTDAEGRLILADALSLASEDSPAAVVDLATLTGACMVALGDKIAGLMGNDDAWIDQVRAAADRAGEPVWPLPLPKEYRRQLESEVADLRNIGTQSHGGALTAGLFLQEFVDGAPWAHVDIAGPARANDDDGYLVKGGTGFGVRTLIELARNFEPPAPAKKAGVKKAGVKKFAARKAPANKAPAKRPARRRTR